MVEQITINPEEVRGYGNICEEHSLEDFFISSSALAKEKETVHGALTNVYKLIYSLYVLMFDFDKGNKQLYLQMGESDILSFGFDTTNKQLYLVDVDDTGFNLGFDEDTNELYITDDAPPIVHNYSLAFSSSSYVATGGSATLEMTLTDNSVPVEGATISVSGSDGSLYTGITNSSGVGTVTVSNVSSETTFTASYSGASATCTVTVGPAIPYQQVEYLQSNGSQYINTGYILKANDKVEVSVSMQGNGQYNGVFGARKNDYAHNAYALFGRFGGSNRFVYTRTGDERSGNVISTNVIYDVTTDGSTCTIKQNGTLVQTLTNTGTIEDCVNPCGLFVINTYNGADGFNKDTYGYMKIYSFKITDSNDNVIMDLIPVRDGTTGYMYDKVTGNLMTNYGTFLYGADI